VAHPATGALARPLRTATCLNSLAMSTSLSSRRAFPPSPLPFVSHYVSSPWKPADACGREGKGTGGGPPAPKSIRLAIHSIGSASAVDVAELFGCQRHAMFTIIGLFDCVSASASAHGPIAPRHIHSGLQALWAELEDARCGMNGYSCSGSSPASWLVVDVNPRSRQDT
jgi:hypothetical protein